MQQLIATNLDQLLDRFRPAALFFFTFLSLSAHANDANLISSIQAFLYEQTQDLGDEVHIEVFPPAAQLPPCTHPQPFLPRAGQPKWGRVTIAVRCGKNGEQVRYMQASVQVFGNYLVPIQDIQAGTIIHAQMLDVQYGDLSALPKQTILNSEDVIGQLARRPLQAGQVIQQHQLREMPLVERGQQVTIEAAGRGFRITREGTAMEAGAMGAQVRVKISRRDILVGTVVGQGRLVVNEQ